MEPELQLLLDKQAITEVLHRYSRGIDRKDRETLSSVYWGDATDDHAGLFSGGPPELIDYLLKSVAPMRTMHVISNVLIDRVGPDNAWAESYVFSYHVVEIDGALRELIGAGRYLDRFARRGGEWRILARKVVIDYVQEHAGKDGLSAFPTLQLSGQAYPSDALYALQRVMAQSRSHEPA